MKKLIALACAILMMVSIIACAAPTTTEPAKPAAEAPAAAPAAEEAPAEAAEPELNWPDKNETLTIVVNYAAGNTHDIMCRTAEPFLEEELGIDITVENVEGGSGLVGLQKVLAMPNDGYTLVTWSNPKHDVDSCVTEKNPEPAYTYEDWVAVGSFNKDMHMIVVPKDSPFNTFEELIAYATEHPEELNWAGTGTAPGVCSLGLDAVQEATGTKFTYVPFSGGTGECVTALMGGHVDVACLGTSGSYENYVKTGEMKALALISNARKENIPDLPCVAELIGKELPAYAGNACRMLMVSSKVDPAIIARLQEAWAAVGANPEFVEAYQATGAEFTMVTWEECQAIRADTCAIFTN